MKLIVGLGNPGDFYADSRHNIGFSVIRALSKGLKAPLKRDKGTFSLSGRAGYAKQSLILAMPLTFMNLSGNAVADLAKKYRIDLNNLLVVCDDLDLEFGRIRIRARGSSGGQRGLASIIEVLGSDKFARLRIGIGRPVKAKEASEYVLSPFTGKEKKQMLKVLSKAQECCETWVNQGITEAMNIFNQRSLVRQESRRTRDKFTH
ncbi:MAG: aminoacyl-tRNA hydrolase [Candidatus Omnitrophica bacterium]|nr:aminoacyl-tRNA hydrolase [Candidatus Omnitrophota bacterium]MBL7151402.1 aminoacyl-tRNA hydrolase [Candidatus Omnitrophota bacterium]